MNRTLTSLAHVSVYRRMSANVAAQKLQYLTSLVDGVPHKFPLDAVQARFIDDVADQAQQFLGAYEKMKGRCK